MLYPLVQALTYAVIAAVVVVVVGPLLVILATRTYLGLRWLYRQAFRVGLSPETRRREEERRKMLDSWQDHARKE